MGTNFHPRVIGRMAWKDGRDQELLMLETAAFDPIWTEFNWDREGRCTVPCLRDYGAVFRGKTKAIKDEWESYDGPQLALLDLNKTQESSSTSDFFSRINTALHETTAKPLTKRSVTTHGSHTDEVDISPVAEPLDSFTTTPEELHALTESGAVKNYILDHDKYPPNNRTLENFFRGAWTYHVHNQWLKRPEPSSWLAVLQDAQDGFFAGKRVNPYGESWKGPEMTPYNKWSELV